MEETTFEKLLKSKKQIELHILKEDYEGLKPDERSYFGVDEGCLLEKAAKRQFQTDDVTEHVNSIYINGERLAHRWFYDKEFYDCVKDEREFSIILKTN